jgi:tetratricopeptide (TPR) repeat protein
MIPGPVLGESPALDDDGAAARLETMKRNGILRDPFWAHAYWVRADTAPTNAARISDLQWALRFDSELQGARLDLAAALIRKRDPACATQLLDAVRHFGTSFPAQQELVLLLLGLGGGVSLIVLVICALVSIGRTVGATHHAISERLAFLPAEVRSGAAILTLGAPFLLTLPLPPTSALFWVLLLGTAGAWTMLGHGERRICLWALGGMLVLPWGIALWTRLLEPSFPGSYPRLLWETQSTADPLTIDSLRRARDSDHPLEADILATLALAARRQGDLVTSADLLKQAVEKKPEAWGYRNNLGNVLLLAGDPDRALEAYAQAHQRAPSEPIIRVNEAQAWMRKLEFHRANEALDEARRLGAHLPPTAGSTSEEAFLFEDTLDAPAIWKVFLGTFDSPRVLGWDRALAMSRGLLFPIRPSILCIPLAIALLYVTQTRRLPRIHTCASCGKTVCRKCHYRVLRQSLCMDCYAIRSRVRAPIQREEALSRRRRSMRRIPWLVGLVLAAACPGTGHFLEARPAAASALLFAWVATLALGRGIGDLGPSSWSSVVTFVYGVLVLISVTGYMRLAARHGSPFTFRPRGI